MINAWGITDKGAVRVQNQDAYYLEKLSEEQAIGVVCDGMGGARAGNIASMVAVETFIDVLQDWQKAKDHDGDTLLSRAVERANEEVCLRATHDVDCRGMGTTMVATYLLGSEAHLVNIGDSRGYHVSGVGIQKVTRDHSVVEDLVLRGDITPEEARSHPQKNLITRCLGTEPIIQADLFRLELHPGEYILLCSDGLSNVVTDQEILYEIIHGGPAEECCKRLLEIAMTRGAPDNVTAVLLQRL